MDSLNDSEMLSNSNEKSEIYSINTQNLLDSADVTRRRSSNRSIKRRKFDDELVEYSLGVPGISAIKSGRARTQSSHSDYSSIASPAPLPPVIPTPAFLPYIEPKRKPLKLAYNNRRNKKGRQPNQIATKDLGRWKPTDDLALIIGVQQTNDLRTVHLGTKFSCKFTVQELQQRWYALLYDQAVSRVAVSAMRNLHPDMVAAVQDKALWSESEERLLGEFKSHTSPNLEAFADLLAQHADVFYAGRTAHALNKHWMTMRMYHLLPDQVLGAQQTPARPIMTFNDAEDMLVDAELADPPDEAVDRELMLQQRRNIREIRQLENEVGRWNVLVDSVTGMCPGEMDNQTLAVLRGKMVRYLMRSREITIGRTGKGHLVDIDLALEGPAHKVSRRQATLRLRNTGEFYLSSEGKRPIFVDGRPIAAGNKVRLYDNAVVEISCLRFIFSVNHDLIRAIHIEAVRYNAPA